MLMESHKLSIMTEQAVLFFKARRLSMWSLGAAWCPLVTLNPKLSKKVNAAGCN